MKKTLLLKTMLLLWALMVGSGTMWADEVTYTFTSKSWDDSEKAWTSGKDGNALTSNRGVQITSGVTGANATTKSDFANVSKIVVTYSTNASKGAGSVSIQVGSNDATSKNITSVGTTDHTLEYTYGNPQSGAVKITVACSQNSIYIKSISISYNTSGGGSDLTDCDLALTGAPVALNFDLYNNSSAQVINYTTSSTGAVTIADSEFATFAINETAKTITVTPTAVTPSAQTITVNQAADENYKDGSATFLLTITDSTPQTGGWVLTNLADLAAGDVFVIVGDNTYALSNDNGAGSAPKAVEVTIANNEITSDVSNNIKWNISGNATDGYTFYPNGTTETWLYCNTTASSSSNNNMRVGTGGRKVFALSGDNLVTKDSYTARYVSIYDNTDWRGYVNTNLAPSIAFYKYEESSKANPELSFAVAEVNANISEQFEAPTLNTAEGFNGTVEYESSDETVAQIMNSETGELRLLKEGTTTITATFAGDDNFKAGSASYTLNVTDDRIATTTIQDPIELDLADVATLTRLAPIVKDANNNIIAYQYDEWPTEMSFEIVSDDNYIIGSIDNNSGEITLNEVVGTATLKACYNAFNVNNTYKPSECTFTITVEKVMTISEVRAQGEGSVTTKGVVTSCSGTTAYIQDENAAICVYGSALTVGDEVKVKGTLTTYNGLLEITSPTVTVLSQNNTMTPEVMTIYQINESLNQGWLVKIENAKVIAIDELNTTIAQDGNTIVARGITADIAVNDIITLTGNIGCYKVAQIANPTDVTITAVTITMADACNDGEGNYYGTYSNASAFIVPDDLTVAEVGIDGNSKLIVETYETGDVVPANTGVMVSSATAGAHVVLLSTGGTSLPSVDNRLRATGNEGITAEAMSTADNNCVFYRLTMHNGTDLGFYWGAEEGAAFAVAANKAYLAVPKAAAARIQGFSFDGGTITGINNLTPALSQSEGAIFDLQGRSVANPAKGLYIKNGKKVVVK